MKDVSKLLVPLDGSKNSMRGLDMAIILAKQCNASITSVHSVHIQSHSSFRSANEDEERTDEYIKGVMEEAEQKVAKYGIEFDYKVMNGDIGYNIIKYAKENEFDMIIMGSRGRNAIKNMLFGSVTNSVLQSSKIPVLVVK